MRQFLITEEQVSILFQTIGKFPLAQTLQAADIIRGLAPYIEPKKQPDLAPETSKNKKK